MAKYQIEIRGTVSKEWEVSESGSADSRRKFLKGIDRKKLQKTQWRCIQS